ncbi:hypothetical protein pneo_cds_440 [Pandoravirus neocaledonia]|uniref:Uncharacterized protein n=1 Tax=Pandoravirus neocaledonia TaxID=2107708 RepID=A0A2U7UC64_9VIRU|nr:hypothetical protein pneo_cds_440 [Pandoravirus neocaledonia]AVK76047.1 hypothetical protein pneo_cds_440 [Pandoravirus neocaledonia]
MNHQSTPDNGRQEKIERALHFGGALTAILGGMAVLMASPFWTYVFVGELSAFTVLCAMMGAAPHSAKRASALTAARLVRLVDAVIHDLAPSPTAAFDVPHMVADAVALADHGPDSPPLALHLYVAPVDGEHRIVYTRSHMDALWPGLFRDVDGIEPASVLFTAEVVGGPTDGEVGLPSVVLHRTTRSASNLDLFSCDPVKKRAALAHTA